MPGSPVTLPAPDLPAGPRSALVIATGSYADPRFGRLRSPARDAADLAAVLADPALGGFEVTRLLDSGVHALRIGIYDFLISRQAEETVVVYLSCHGALSARRLLYFTATDTDQDRLAATGLDARWLTECLDECRARRQVIILDCCFSGAFALAKGSEDVRLQEWFGEAEQGRGRTVLTASRATEYSFEGKTLTSGRATGSVFTAALLDGVRTGAADRDRDGLVSVSEAYAYAYQRVRDGGGGQTPQRWLYGGEGKDVMLARSPAGIVVEPAKVNEDLMDGLKSRYPSVRIGALEEVARWLDDPNPARVVAARAIIEEIAAEDIPAVARAARAHLDGHPGPPVQVRREPPGHPAQGRPAAPAPARQSLLALRYAVRSDVGLLMEGNEDSAYAGPHLLAVAGGTGDHGAGAMASSTAITALAPLDAEDPGPDLAGALADAAATANLRLQELIISDPAIEGMGTTLTALLWSEGHAALCHIGDSRAYLLRDGQFIQITHDHTLVQSLVDEGKITEDDVATHPHRSLLLQALDGRRIAEPDLAPLETYPGDRYLLCSDGLSDVVTEQTLHQTLTSVSDPDKAVLKLIELAIRGGGPDNITCIVADVIDSQNSRVPPTWQPMFAGAAAAQTASPATGQSSPATRALRLSRTAPQPVVPEEPATGVSPRLGPSADKGRSWLRKRDT